MIVLNVTYITKQGKRSEFYNSVKNSGVPEKSRSEEGNHKYDYYMSADNEDELLLIEHWEDEEAFTKHTQTPHFKELQAIKEKYVDNAEILKARETK